MVEAPELDIVGRQDELAELTELLLSPGTREVTITGPGGTGKTRLAIELASALSQRFAHGAFFVDLSTLAEPDQVAPALAQALELTLPPGRTLEHGLGRLLRDRELLVVLDNFEQVDEAAPLVRTLIRAAPRLRVVVTSRVVLGIQGETEYRLEPLPARGLGEVPSPPPPYSSPAARSGSEQTSTTLPTLDRSSRSANVSTDCRWRSSWWRHVRGPCRWAVSHEATRQCPRPCYHR